LLLPKPLSKTRHKKKLGQKCPTTYGFAKVSGCLIPKAA